jgi:hypothetical protein
MADFLKSETAAPSATSSLADAGLLEYKRRQAEADRQREADIKSGKLVIIDAGYEERRIRKQQADLKAKQEAARIEFVLNAAMVDATPMEAQLVREVIARKYPADKLSPERHWSVLQTIRHELGNIG